MALSDLDFLGRTVGLVGLFFICCSILHQKPKHALEELFGVYHGGLRRLRGSVFRKNQLVLGFLCAAVAVILEQFGHVLGDGSAGRVAAASPSAQVLTWLATV
ncbi:MAG TPA: hypothetical protein VEI02_00560, partial [Planctomycetota bacterium]|nr:hypothetical protein [Planctomycetota bacterium]